MRYLVAVTFVQSPGKRGCSRTEIHRLFLRFLEDVLRHREQRIAEAIGGRKEGTLVGIEVAHRQHIWLLLAIDGYLDHQPARVGEKSQLFTIFLRRLAIEEFYGPQRRQRRDKSLHLVRTDAKFLRHLRDPL